MGIEIKRSPGERAFDAFNVAFMACFALAVVLPFAYIVMVSLTNKTNIAYFFHEDTRISLEAYKTALSSKLYRAFVISVLRTVVGTGLNMAFTVMMAYVISREGMPGKKAITMMMVFTMLFGAGLIPSYLLTTVVLKLKNSYFVYVLPGLISTYYCILLRNSFSAVPASLVESVKIDGGSDWRVLANVMVPLSTPALATIALFYAVGHWNAWFDAVLYMSDSGKYPMQVLLRAVSVNTALANEMGQATNQLQEIYVPPEAIINATLVITTIPIVCVYPFLQRYFIKGIVIGAVKE